MGDYGKWIGNLTRRVEKIERDSAADEAVGRWKRWVFGGVFTVINILIALVNLYLNHR